MPLPEAIRKEIVKLSSANKYDEIVTYLKTKLEEEAIIVKDVLEYVRGYRYTERPGKPYVVNADTINKLGVVTSELKDKSILQIEFFKLAAERKSELGHRNLAQCYFDGNATKQNFDLALEHMEIALKLGYKKGYLLYGRILMAKEKLREAIETFKKVDDKKEKDSAIKEISTCCFQLGQQCYQKHKYKEAANFLNKVEKDSKHWQSARKLMPVIFKHQLELLYKKVETESDSKEPKATSDNIVTSKIEPQVPQGWFRISKFLEGFEVKSCEELELKLKYLELKSEMFDGKIEYLQRLKKLTENQDEDKFKQTSAKLEKTKEKQKDLKQKIVEFKKTYRNYIDVFLQIRKRQFKIEDRFFNPGRTKSKSTLSIAQELVARRASHQAIEEPLNVTDNPARRLITAERSTIESSRKLLDMELNGWGYIESGMGWTVHRTETQYGYSGNYHQKYSFDECVQIGNFSLTYQQRVNCHKNHLGDFYMRELGTYCSVYRQLEKITDDPDKEKRQNNEKRLAECMLAFCKSGMPVDLSAIKEINPNNCDFSEDDVLKINRIFYHCFVKEIASWMLPQDENHKLPLAIIQARALKLIIAGYLTLEEVFSSNAPYGIFTGSNIGRWDGQEELIEKIDKINSLYHKAILERSDGYIQFFKAKPQAQIIATYENLHQELLDTFGGQDDSDNEEYESDGERTKNYQDMLNI